MKTAFALLVIFNIVVALAVAAFFFRYSIVETVGGDEFLIVLQKQSAECGSGGGCAVFSHREWVQSVEQIVGQMRRNRL
jgi:GGDEF domain-containing protein